MKIPPEDQLRALLQEEIARTINAAGTNHGETVFLTGTAARSENASATANVIADVNVSVTVELVIKGKFTHDDIEEITGTFARFGRAAESGWRAPDPGE